MDEEVITWNLKGPKRMRKRRELNALLKNNLKYQSLLKNQSNNNNCSLNMDQSSRRFLSNLNDSSSDNDEFYFSANKTFIQQRKRTYYCKIFQMILIGFVITFVLLIGIILVFSYTKFHDVLIDLKSELNSQNEQNQKSIDKIKQQMKEYDTLFKKLNDSRKLTRDIRSIDLNNHLNKYLNEWISNKSSNNYQNHIPKYDLKSLISSTNKTNETSDYSNFSKLITNILNSQDIKKYFDEFTINNHTQLLATIERNYFKPLLAKLDNCKCDIQS